MGKLLDFLILNWLDQRTGYKALLRGLMDEPIPGGARWRHALGFAVLFNFLLLAVTGIALSMNYSPNTVGAWESVYYIHYVLEGGWLLRSIHHHAANVMIVLMVLWGLSMVFSGSYRPPREFTFWTALPLLLLVLAFGVTGYLLPWDQMGYWSTQVRTNIMALSPGIGEDLKRLVVGGSEYGHLTLTRFYTLHTVVLPAAFVLVAALHVYSSRLQGRSGPAGASLADAPPFWPSQALRHAVLCVVVAGACVGLSYLQAAPLLAPADAGDKFAGARPEWYFLFLYQFLRLKQLPNETWGAIYIPGMVMGYLFLMPLLGRFRVLHWVNCVVCLALLAGMVYLSSVAVTNDMKDEALKLTLKLADSDAHRVRELASAKGIPPAGAATLLREDPLVGGAKLFAQHCASCHTHGGTDARGKTPTEPQSAPELKGFASRDWLKAFFDPKQIAAPHMLGNTAFKKGDMVKIITEDVPHYAEDEKQWLSKVIIALSAEAQLPSQKAMDAKDTAIIEAGRGLMGDEGLTCLDCHRFRGQGKSKGPDLTGYGSREWVIGIISDPEHTRFYGKKNDRMPRFGASNILTQKEIELLADFLREDYLPEGAE